MSRVAGALSPPPRTGDGLSAEMNRKAYHYGVPLPILVTERRQLRASPCATVAQLQIAGYAGTSWRICRSGWRPSRLAVAYGVAWPWARWATLTGTRPRS